MTSKYWTRQDEKRKSVDYCLINYIYEDYSSLLVEMLTVKEFFKKACISLSHYWYSVQATTTKRADSYKIVKVNHFKMSRKKTQEKENSHYILDDLKHITLYHACKC